MDDFEAILKTEYSTAFDEHRKKAMINSFYKYTPVYNYVYGGSEYNVSGIFTCRARIGDSVTIFIAPSNPRVLYNPTENSRQVTVALFK